MPTVHVPINVHLNAAPIVVIGMDYDQNPLAPLVLVTLQFTDRDRSPDNLRRVRLDRAKKWFIDRVSHREWNELLIANAPVIIAIIEERIARAKRASA